MANFTYNPAMGAGSEITLRDQVAMQVLATLIGNDPTIAGADEISGVTESAYRVADQQLATRAAQLVAAGNTVTGGPTP